MTLASPPRPKDRPADALAPLRLPEDLQLTARQFAAVCHANPHTGSETGARNSTVLILLGLAVRASGLPVKLFDSSSGFRLPDGSVLSPDVSLVRQERWESLTPEERRGFAPLCPDLVVELASPSDEGPRGLVKGHVRRGPRLHDNGACHRTRRRCANP